MRTFVCPEAKEEKRNGPPEREVRRAQGGDETVGVRTACCFRKKATAGFSKEGGAFSPATCSITTTLESLMFDTWASYESTRAFVTSSFLWQRRGSDFQTATLAAWQPSNRLHITLRHLRAATIQSSRRHERPSISTGRTTPLSLATLPTRPIRVRPTQSEHSGQRIDACERLSPPRPNSSRDDENHPISGRSPPRKGHPREKMPLSPTNATADESPSQGHRRVALRVQSPGVFLQLRPQPAKKRRLPDQPALSFLSFANAFLALFAQGSSRTTSGAVRTCERLFGKARPPRSGSPSRSGRSPTPADACPRPRAHLTW